RQGAECIDEGLFLQEPPQLLGPATGERVFHREGTPQADDFFRGVTALDPLPTVIFRPLTLQLPDFIFACAHASSPRDSKSEVVEEKSTLVLHSTVHFYLI